MDNLEHLEPEVKVSLAASLFCLAVLLGIHASMWTSALIK